MTKRIFRASCIALLLATAEADAQSWTGYHTRAWSQSRLATAEQVSIYAAPCSITVTSYPSATSAPVVSASAFWAGVALTTNMPSALPNPYEADVVLLAQPWRTNEAGDVYQVSVIYTARVSQARVLTNLALQAEDVMGFDLWRAMRERRILTGDTLFGDMVFYRHTADNLQAFKTWFKYAGYLAAPTLSNTVGNGRVIAWGLAPTDYATTMAPFYAQPSNWLVVAGLASNWLDYTPSRFVPDDSPRSGRVVTSEVWGATGAEVRVSTNASILPGLHVSDYWFRPATQLVSLIDSAWSRPAYEMQASAWQQHAWLAQPEASTLEDAIALAEAAPIEDDWQPPVEYVQLYPIGLGGGGFTEGPYKYSITEGGFDLFAARRYVSHGYYYLTNRWDRPAQLIHYVTYGPNVTNEPMPAPGVEFSPPSEGTAVAPARYYQVSAMTSTGGVMSVALGDTEMGWAPWSDRRDQSEWFLIGWNGWFVRGSIGVTRYQFDYR